MKVNREYIIETILYLVKSLLVETEEKKGLYLSFRVVTAINDNYYVHMLFVSPATSMNAFASSINDFTLRSVDRMTQYACSRGGVFSAQVEEMVKELFFDAKEIEYANSIQLKTVQFEGEENIGAEFRFSISEDNENIKLDYI